MGTYNNKEGNEECFDCPLGRYCLKTGMKEGKACPPGRFGNSTKAYECSNCGPGQYQDEEGQAKCKSCPAGSFNKATYGGKVLSDVCSPCAAGRYNSVAGNEKCTDCPPGSYCDKEGMSQYRECQVGSFSNDPLSTTCQPCVNGTYQPQTGFAFCYQCPMGKFNNITGADSPVNSSCHACPVGRYSDVEGMSECRECTKGEYQDETGMSECKQCAEGESDGGVVTSKPGSDSHADCVQHAARSLDLVQLVRNYAVDWWVTFVVAAVFMALAASMTYMREQYPDDLANYSRLEAMCHSFFPGFNFGASVFLLMLTGKDFPAIFASMVLARSLHFAGGVVVISCLFLSDSLVEKCGMEGLFSRLRDKINRDFARDNAYMIECVALFSLCDVTMLQFMPWSKSKFYVLSEGYVTPSFMLFCLVLKSVDTLITVSCEIAFLREADADDQTRAFYILNVVFGVVTIAADMLIVCLRGAILGNYMEHGEADVTDQTPKIEKVDKMAIETGDKAQEQQREGNSSEDCVSGSPPSTDDRTDGGMSFEILYPEAPASDDAFYVSNPMLEGGDQSGQAHCEDHEDGSDDAPK